MHPQLRKAALEDTW